MLAPAGATWRACAGGSITLPGDAASVRWFTPFTMTLLFIVRKSRTSCHVSRITYHSSLHLYAWSYSWTVTLVWTVALPDAEARSRSASCISSPQRAMWTWTVAPCRAIRAFVDSCSPPNLSRITHHASRIMYHVSRIKNSTIGSLLLLGKQPIDPSIRSRASGTFASKYLMLMAHPIGLPGLFCQANQEWI